MKRAVFHFEDTRAMAVYGDAFGDTQKSFEIYREWLKMARPGRDAAGLHQPLWLNWPVEEMFYL